MAKFYFVANINYKKKNHIDIVKNGLQIPTVGNIAKFGAK